MTAEEWSRALHEVASLFLGQDTAMLPPLVSQISEDVRFLDPFMSRYCALTCSSCEDPCCHGKEIFFNQADLIWLLASGQPVPPGQTRSIKGEPCRYLNSSGCTLPRMTRPYVCVWFLCEAQMQCFSHEPTQTQRKLLAAFQRIRANRLHLEAHYESFRQEAERVSMDIPPSA